MSIVIKVEKMACEGCITNIASGLEKIGLNKSDLDFNLENKSVTIKSENIKPQKIIKTMNKIKYPAEIIND